MLLMLALIVTVLSISIHCQALLLITKLFKNHSRLHPTRIILPVLLAVFAHLIEIIIFALGWQIMLSHEIIEFSIASPTFLDLIYFSGATYTTVGYGDIYLLGQGRVIAVLEAVTGLVLIAWTASFTFFEMNRYWNN